MRATLKRQHGRLYEIPILILLVILLAMGFATSGFSWRALIVPAFLIGILVALVLFGMVLGAIGEAWTRWRVGRKLDQLLAGAPAGPIVKSLAATGVPASAVLKRDGLFELATQPGPARAAVLDLLLDMREEAVRAKLRPLLSARIAHVEEPEFANVMLTFYVDTDPAVGAALLARAAPPARRKVLERILAGHGLAQIRKDEAGWARQWGPVVAPYRDDLLALRDPARPQADEAIDALLAAAP